MTTLLALKRQAGQSARWRGHALKRWSGGPSGRTAITECLDCVAWVQVETHPAPNSVDIGGSAVARDCPVKA